MFRRSFYAVKRWSVLAVQSAAFGVQPTASYGLLRGPRATKHPAVEPDEHAHEAEQPDPRAERELFGHETYRRVLREADDEARVDDAPQALADDQPRSHERAQTLRALRVRRPARALVV